MKNLRQQILCKKNLEVTLKIMKNILEKILEKSWNFVSPQKWEPCHVLQIDLLSHNQSVGIFLLVAKLVYEIGLINTRTRNIVTGDVVNTTWQN